MPQKEQFDIVTTVELEGGLAKMCNLSDYIEEKGIQQGKIEQQLENLRAVMTNLNLPVEKAMDILNVPQEARAKYREQI